VASFLGDVLYGAERKRVLSGPGSSSGRCTGWTGPQVVIEQVKT